MPALSKMISLPVKLAVMVELSFDSEVISFAETEVCVNVNSRLLPFCV